MGWKSPAGSRGIALVNVWGGGDACRSWIHNAEYLIDEINSVHYSPMTLQKNSISMMEAYPPMSHGTCTHVGAWPPCYATIACTLIIAHPDQQICFFALLSVYS